MKRWENGQYIDLTLEEEAAEMKRRAEAEAEAKALETSISDRLARIAAFRTKAKTGRITLDDVRDVLLALVGE